MKKIRLFNGATQISNPTSGFVQRSGTEEDARPEKAEFKSVSQAIIRERERFAEVLHDQVQPLVVGAQLQLAALRITKASEQIDGALGRIDRILAEALRVSRCIAAEFSEENVGLEQSLASLAQWAASTFQLKVSVRFHSAVLVRDKNIQRELIHAIRELLLNTAKHSGVKTARVSVSIHKTGLVRVTVTDRGAGFDCKSIEAQQDMSSGLGLRRMRRRLEGFGGRLEISSTPGNGSKFTIVLPVR